MIDAQQHTMPSPSFIERDVDGRLVGVTIGDSLSNADNTWLVAVDGSQHSIRATAHVVGIARRMTPTCSICLINVQPWLSKEAAESELLSRGWEATAKARWLLDEGGIAWRLQVDMGDPADRIVALSNRLSCAGIVIGSHGLGTTQSLLLGSVAYKVIHLTTVSVLVVR